MRYSASTTVRSLKLYVMKYDYLKVYALICTHKPKIYLLLMMLAAFSPIAYIVLWMC